MANTPQPKQAIVVRGFVNGLGLVRALSALNFRVLIPEQKSMPNTIQATIEEAAGVPRQSYPVTHGRPFPKGALHDPGQVRLTQAQGDELPLATTVLATWPDGSIKWLLLDTQVTLRARQILPLVIEYGQDITHTQVTSPLQISPLTDGLRVETGALTVTLNGSGPAPFA